MGMGMVWVWMQCLYRVPCEHHHMSHCLFGLMRHPGTATALAEARVKRLCDAVCCALSQRLLPGVGLH